ncbi:Probable NAD-dependent malic enzyme 2 [Neisseria dentiae]|nr:Probable NAD-dependent malic enzyme 2 [Neisseria dentiae]
MSKTPDILKNPLTNRGTAFTQEERAKLGLTGRLPAAVETLDQQAARTYRQFSEYEKNIEKYIFLDQLHNRNEVLYYKLITDHLAEMLPIVYDPTVGEAIAVARCISTSTTRKTSAPRLKPWVWARTMWI